MIKQTFISAALILFFSQICSAKTSVEQKDSIYFVVDRIPEYPGGKQEMQKFIFSNFKRPKDYGETCLTGYIFIRFAVLTDGSIDSVKIARSVDSQLDNEAIKVVKSMPRWKPGEINGKPVSSWCIVRFNAGSVSD